MKNPKIIVTSIGLAGVLLVTLWCVRHRRIAPYPYPIGQAPDVSRQIATLEDRIHKNPDASLDRAILASLYAALAKQSGDVSGYDRAEQLAEESLKRLPFGNTGALLTLAQVAEARHDFARAIQLAQRARSEGRKNEGLALLVTSQLALGDLTTASRYADELITLRPALSNFALRALVLTAQGRDEEAEHDFRKALAVEDLGEVQESAWVRCLLARFYLRKGRLREARSLLDEALRIVPSYHLGLDLMGQWAMQKEDPRQAEHFFSEAFASSHQVIDLRHAARAAARMGNTKEAAQLEAQAESTIRADLAEKRYGHRAELAQLLLERGRPADIREAIALATDEYHARPSADIGLVLATALAQASRWADARDIIQSILRTGARDARYFHLAARIAEALGDREEAGFYRSMAIRINPRPLTDVAF